MTCKWSPSKVLTLREAEAWDRYDLNVTVKGEPANLLVFVYDPDGKLIYGSESRGSENKITADEMRLSKAGSKDVDGSCCQKKGTYTVIVRKEGNDKAVATVKVIRKPKGG